MRKLLAIVGLGIGSVLAALGGCGGGSTPATMAPRTGVVRSQRAMNSVNNVIARTNGPSKLTARRSRALRRSARKSQSIRGSVTNTETTDAQGHPVETTNFNNERDADGYTLNGTAIITELSATTENETCNNLQITDPAGNVATFSCNLNITQTSNTTFTVSGTFTVADSNGTFTGTLNNVVVDQSCDFPTSGTITMNFQGQQGEQGQHGETDTVTFGPGCSNTSTVTDDQGHTETISETDFQN